MKQILAMILALTLVFGCIPTPVLAEETTIQTQASVTSIAMDALPVKTEYQIGDALDITGGSMSVSYSDGTIQTIELSADMVSGFNSTVACVQTLTVTYDGLTANFDIEVKDIPIQNDGSDILTVSEDAEINITWIPYNDEHTHNYVDDTCSVCGELHPRYVALDSAEWTAKQVVDDRLYLINLNFKDGSLAVGYGVNIEQFDEVSQEAYLKAYYEGDTSVVLNDGIFYYVGSGDGGNITYTTDGKNVYVNCEDYIDLTFVRTGEKQLTLVESNILGNPTGIILMCGEEPSIDDEHTHDYVDDICTVCGELHPRYVSLDSVEWTAKQVINGTLYQMTLNFGEAGLGITYGDNIDQFDAELRETLLQEYYKGSPAVVLVDGAYFYVGRGDGGNITYTTNEKNVYVNCEDYIDLTFKRTGEKQLTVVGSNLENLIGLVLTCCGDSTIGHEWQEATCATPKVCTICGITEGVATGNHTFDESTHQCACGAYGGKCGDNLTWTFSDGTLTISGTGDMYDYSQDQAPWASLGENITEVVMEEGISRIGDEAFYCCTYLKKASLPASIRKVGEKSFAPIIGDRTYVINQTVRQWRTVQNETQYFPNWETTQFINNAPVMASGVYGKDVYWELDNQGNMVFFGSGPMYDFGAVPTLWGELFVKSVTIEEGITSIGIGAFEVSGTDIFSNTFASVIIPSTVTYIGGNAFSNCKALKTIRFTGNAPIFDDSYYNSFNGVTATCYYPVGNHTWTSNVMQDYGGDITWKAYCPAHIFSEWVTEGSNSSRICTLCGFAEHKVTTDCGDVEIEIPEQPDLEVEVDPILPSEDNYVLVEEVLDSTGNQNQAILKVFDINLKNDGVNVQPSGTVKVKLPLDRDKDGNYKVYRVNDDGTLTDMNAYRQGSQMIFETDHFSLYVIVEETEHRHNYKPEVTAPTCTESGFTTYTCDCGDTYVDDKVAALEHNVVLLTSEAASCELNGFEYYACERCGGKEYTIILESTGHDYENGTCSVCGEKGPDYVKPSKPGWCNIWDWIFDIWWGQGQKCDHAYTAVITAPTCSDKGYTTYTCSKCGDCYKDSYTNALGHAWDDGTVTKEASCTENGVRTYTCGACEKQKKETIKAIGHDYVNGICGGCGAEKNTKPSEPNKPTKPGLGFIFDWIFGSWWK